MAEEMLTFKVGILSDTNATYNSAINLNATTSLIGGSAEAGDLQTLTGKTATIAAGETSADLKIAITDLVVDDNLVELGENFFIELTRGANFPDALAISTEQNRVEVEILNDDTADIGFAANNPEIREGATGTLRVSTTNNVEGDLGVRYTVSGTAQAGVDYEELSGITNNGDIVIQTKLDGEVESPETIDLTLSGVSSEYKIGASNTNALSISATNANTQVRITDIPIVSIVANQTINEATPMLQIITSATVDSEITVNLSIESGTAIAGKDFVANTPMAAVIPANATSATINLSNVTNDNIVELDETIYFIIAKLGDSDEFAVNPDSAKNRVAVTLRSEDRATLDIIAGDRKLDIGEGQNAEIVVASSNPIDIGEDLVINYRDEVINATRNADYSFNVATITIKQGEIRGVLVLESKFDTVEEATEGVRLQITAIQNTVLQNSIYNNYVSIADASVSTITIRDRNTLRLVVANGFITEQADIVELTLQLDRAVADSTTEVAYAVSTGTAGALDFDATNGTVTIKGGQTSTTFGIAIKDDEIVEKAETFLISLTNLRSINATGNAINPSLVIVASESNEVEIRDNDDAQISISPSSLEIAESDSTSITVTSSNQIAEDVTIDIAVSGTAKAADYTALASQVILTKDTTSVTINLATLSDDAIEGDETVIVTIAGITDTAGYEADALTINQAKKETVATIKDEDGAVKLRIESIAGTSEATIDEGNSGTKALFFVVKSDKPLSEAITINFAAVTKAGSARDSQQTNPDFSQSTINSSISGGDTKELSIIINGDRRVERDETFDIALEITSSTAGITATVDSNKSKLQVTITDEDKAIFRFTNNQITGAEDSTVSLTVTTASVIEDVEIELTSNATINSGVGIYNRAAATDYQDISKTLTFSDATKTGIVEYQIKQDKVVELAESFLVMLSAVGNKADTSLAVATVNIAVDTDDTTDFKLENKAVSEGNGGSTEIILTAQLTNPISAPISFNYETTGGTARAGGAFTEGIPNNPIDYLTKSGTATISESDSTTITIRINPDRTVETAENFNVVVLGTLNLGSYYDATQVSFAAGGTSAVATIANDDDAVLDLSVGQVVEPTIPGQTNDLIFTVTIAGGVVTDEDIDFTFNTINGTATAPADYIAVNRTVKIQAGANSTTQIVKIKADSAKEGPETLTGRISAIANSGISGSVSFAGSATNLEREAIIGDSAGVEFRIEVSDIVEGTETTTDVQVKLVVIDIADYGDDPVIVDYEATLDSDAKVAGIIGRASENDFEATTGSLTFRGGTTSDSFTFNIVRDAILEREETLNLKFSIRSGVGFGLGKFTGTNILTSETKLTIQNDDTVDLTISDVSQAENAGAMQFSIASDSTLAEDVTIDIEVSTENGTTSNNDYTALQNGEYKLARVGNTDFSVTINDDNTVEANETFGVNITASSSQLKNNASTIFITDRVTGTINNDDSATLNITRDATAEEGDPITFTVSSTNPIDKAITISYETTNGTAVSPGDYTTASFVPLPAGSTTAEIVVNTVDDDIVKRADESFTIQLSAYSGIYDASITANPQSRTGAIINDDRIELSIVNLLPQRVDEGVSTQFEIRIGSKQVAESITVTYQVSGTATSGLDYNTLFGSIVINQGQTSTILRTLLRLDNTKENDETLDVTITGISPAGYADLSTINEGASSAGITIVDGDGAVQLSIESLTGTNAISVTERDSGSQTLTFRVSSNIEIGEHISVPFRITTAAGSARDSRQTAPDFADTTIDGTISGGNTTTVDVIIYGDNRVERDETFDINLSTEGGNETINNNKSKIVVTITDDDIATFSFVSSSINGAEGSTVSLGVTSDNVVESVAIELTATAVPNSAAAQYEQAAAADYDSNTTKTITFSDSNQTNSIEYSIVNDNIVELNEQFLVRLSAAGNKATRTVSETTVTITDTDTAELSLNSVNETEGNSQTTKNIELTARLTANISAPITFSYETTDDTGANNAARGGNSQAGVTGANPVDYLTTSGTTTISDSSTTIAVTIGSDKTVETAETFRVHLSNLSNEYGGRISFISGGDSAIVTISNDDTAILNLNVGPVTEPAAGATSNLVFTIAIDDGVVADEDIAVLFNTQNGTATAVTDYTAIVNQTITIPAGASSQTQTVVILPDSMPEGPETLIGRIGDLVNSDISGSVEFAGGDDNTEVTASIADADGLDFRIDVVTEQPEGTATTTDVQVTIAVISDTFPAGTDIVISYDATLDQDQKGSGYIGRASESDFEATSGNLTFNSTNTSDTFRFSLTRDTIIEREETLKLLFSITNSTIGQFISSTAANAVKTITIKNDDTTDLNLVADSSNLEDMGAIQFMVASDLEIAKDVTIDITVSTTNGTGTAPAIAGEDYPALLNAVYQVTNSNRNFSVPITPDTKIEATEDFSIMIDASSSQLKNSSNTIIVGTNTATGTIINDDTAVLSISGSASNEGGNIRFTINSTKAIDEAVILNYTTTGSGTAGTDYTAPTGSVELPALATTTTFDIQTATDEIVEEDETIIITISSVTAINKVAEESINFSNAPATGTIRNVGSAANLSITPVNAAVAEGEAIIFTINSTKAIGRAITINYATADTNDNWTASASDYTASGSIMLPAEAMSATFAIQTIQDTIAEANEPFTVNLSGVAAGNIPESAITFDATPIRLTINNDGDKAIITVNRPATADEGSSGETQIPFNFAIGEVASYAGAGVFVEYNNTPLLAGVNLIGADATGSLSIPVIGDKIVEADETINLSIFNSTIVQYGSPPRGFIIELEEEDGILTIIDDDTADLSLTGNVVRENEGGTMTFEVQSSNPIAGEITVDYTIVGSGVYPADPSTDFEAMVEDSVFNNSTGTGTAILDFNGTKTADLKIRAVPDTIVETDEEFTITLTGTENDAVTINSASNDAIGTIENNDIARFTLTQQGNISEGNSGTIMLLVFEITPVNTIADNVEISFTPEINTTSTATINEDFTTTADGETPITLASSDNFNGMFTINIIGDDKVESLENISTEMTLTSSQPEIFTFWNKRGSSQTFPPSNNRSIIRQIFGIINDDTANLTVAAIPESITEPATALQSANLIFRITSDKLIEIDDTEVELTYDLMGAAVASTDYTLPNSNMVNFPLDSTTVDIPIAIIGDDAIESAKTLTMTVTASKPATSFINITDAAATATINNSTEDRPTVNLSGPTNLAEGDATTFTVSLAPVVNYDYDFNYTVTAVSGLVTSGDFTGITLGTPVAGGGSIPAGQDSTTITINTFDDTIKESNESFAVTITNITEMANIGKGTVQVSITDNELGEISNPTAIIDNAKITLNWTNPNSSIFTGVRVFQLVGSTAPAVNCSSGTELATLPTAETYVVSGLTNGNSYSFRICTLNNAQNPTSSPGTPFENLIPKIVDSDGNGLIEIATAAKLNSVRHNLTGTDYKANSGDYPSIGGCPNGICSGYELTANIDLNSITNWLPIGDNSNRFRNATFDGKNKIISNLSIDRMADDYVGLFGSIENSTISNLELSGANVTGGNYVGALAGEAITSNLSNIELMGDANQGSANAEIRGNGNNVGGLVGWFSGDIKDSSSSFTVRGGASDTADNIGGLVGNFSSGTITNSHSSGSVSASDGADNVGALVGNQAAGMINQSWSMGNVSNSGASSTAYGGLVGNQAGGSINRSWSSSNVIGDFTGNSSYGGLVGNQAGGSIYQSWSRGNVSSNLSGRSVGIGGGLVGNKEGNITQIWSSGILSHSFTTMNKGGLIGNDAGGNTSGRNYQLGDATGNDVNLANGDGAGESFVLAGLYNLAVLSGGQDASYGTHSNWHAGFVKTGVQTALDTMYCDADNNGIIEGGEQVPSNSVWVMGPDSDIAAPNGFFAIPAIRCIGNTPAERLANIDLQRRQFPILIDSDRDGLIDVTNDTQFNNIRHNLAGTGYKTSGAVAGNGVTSGCPNDVCIGYELLENIDLSGYANWEPIGSDSSRFTATLEGNNHTISNLTIDKTTNNVGLFGFIDNAILRNFKMTNVSVKGATNVGALAGQSANANSYLSNIALIGDASQTASNAEVQGTGNNIGGLVGSFGNADNTTGGTIENSFSSLTVSIPNGTSQNRIGGLAGLSVNSRISKSWASGNVSRSGNTSSTYLGGLIGLANGGTTRQSWASGNISIFGGSVNQQRGGGLAGIAVSTEFSQVWASGEVTADGDNSLIGIELRVGGLVGGSKNAVSISTRNRNYQLDSKKGGLNIILKAVEGPVESPSGVLPNLEALVNLSGAAPSATITNTDYLTHSNWYSGISGTGISNRENLLTRYCDINGNGSIDGEERTVDNTVWVMSSEPTGDALPPEMIDNVPAPDGFRAIPAIRCIGNTDIERAVNIDLQRRQFPNP